MDLRDRHLYSRHIKSPHQGRLLPGATHGTNLLKQKMRAVLTAIALAAAIPIEAHDSFRKDSCTFHGKKLYGKIQVVTAFPDVKVQVVNAFPDVRVIEVQAFPDQCGMWQMVDAFPDTKVQFVDSFPDVKIQYVDAFPGAH